MVRTSYNQKLAGSINSRSTSRNDAGQAAHTHTHVVAGHGDILLLDTMYILLTYLLIYLLTCLNNRHNFVTSQRAPMPCS